MIKIWRSADEKNEKIFQSESVHNFEAVEAFYYANRNILWKA